MRQEIGYQDTLGGLPQRFLPIFIGPTTFKQKEEVYPTQIRLTSGQLPPFHYYERQNGTVLKHLVILGLVCNDGLADVYLVQDHNNSSLSYHAHAFLNEEYGKN